ncbi:MAG: MBL fold metallo-hydrolase [Proteobacteria bacterium]|nr:MBL fold metallo-hydrolase [Pseudomonadota bacterium]
MKYPFRFFEPSFFSGLLDDPLLVIRIRPMARNFLVDCGQINHLAKRVLKSVEALFITHAHMDHFMGIDKFTRNVLVMPRTIDLFGPPGISEKLERKLQGYDWNLVEDFYCTYRVHEVFTDLIKTSLLKGSERFSRCYEQTLSIKDKTIYRNKYLSVEADLCDHKIPTLIFKFTEQPGFLIDEKKIEKLGYQKGPWLKTLKKWFYHSEIEEQNVTIPRRYGQKVERYPAEELERLYRTVKKDQKPASIGYITDIGFTENNLERVFSLMKGVTLLFCECTYLRKQETKARRSHHLCTSDLNRLIEELQPEFVLPMHLSKTYLGQTRQLYEELRIPSECTLLQVPERLTPKPLISAKLTLPESRRKKNRF